MALNTPSARPLQFLIALGFVALYLGCSSEPTGAPVVVPTVDAGRDTVVQLGATVLLRGRAYDDGVIERLTWYIEGADVPFESPAGTLSVACPAYEDSSFVCVLQATDDEGGAGVDTVVLWVTDNPGLRVNRPNGGESYHIGDTLRVEMWPTPGRVHLLLEIDEWTFGVPGLDRAVEPLDSRDYAFVIPAQFYDEVWDPATQTMQPETISTVSDQCRITMLDYYDNRNFDSSDDPFAILP